MSARGDALHDESIGLLEHLFTPTAGILSFQPNNYPSVTIRA
ncbi:MAG: hypothetical protein ACRC01_03165 [Deefgea sp.]